MNSSAFERRRPGFTLVEIMIVVVMVGLLCTLAVPQFAKVRNLSQDGAVLNNARQLASAASQYYLASGASSVETAALVGPTGYIKNLITVAGERYPTELYANTPILVTGIAGVRTMTFAP